MNWAILIALAGWFLAILQFVLTFREAKDKNEAELLEKTLNYFNQGEQARSIGISLVEGIWLKRKKNLNIILPVLTAQVLHLLTQENLNAQDNRNIFRLLSLIEKLMPYATNKHTELAEISEALMWGAQSHSPAHVSLRAWYKKFNGDTDMWDAEIENS
ncbi:hypothetical protein OH456_06500 [Vibrio sp. La 4.2.2]|uniref:hypothetical protein n=1 Tax=Vibrio sp. La 4.2.2 TaxID=2998830 RepID=UPI0022CDE479|nr:hypothetical protein [Vibrio sp. La 4.2.2]MDA0107785.1 hypothetical protein [Vibrio sp. La 4.2.2]